MTLESLMAAPWSVRLETRYDDGRYMVATIEELPGLVATGRDDEALENALGEALESHLRSYLDAGEDPPMPASTSRHFSVSYSDGAAPPHLSDQGSEGDTETTWYPAARL